MSRLSKFLRQTCRLEVAKVDSKGLPMLNEFGECIYRPAKVVKCRKESVVQTVQTSEGELVTSTTRYYLDSTVSIKVSDKLDGCVVVSVSSFTNEAGINEGFECYV